MVDTLVNRVIYLGENQPEKLAVAFKKECLSYYELSKKMKQIGAKLSILGVRKSDRVLFTAVSKPEMLATYLGIQYIGAVAVFVDKNSTVENAAAIYEDTQAVLFLTDKSVKEYQQSIKLYSLKQIYEDEVSDNDFIYHMPNQEDIAELLFTTGTTGKPKGVILTYKSVYNILSNTIEGIGIIDNEIMLLPLPLNHSFALRVLRAIIYKGATLVLQNGFAFAKEVENNQEMFKCTAMAAVPASMEILRGQMQERFVPIMQGFRYIEIGAGSLTIEQRKRLTKELPDTVLYNTWGSSETGGALFINVTECKNHLTRISAVGKPLGHIEVKVIDEDGNEIKSDIKHTGRLTLKGDMLMAGYWHRDELTNATLKDGWLMTSDIVYTDDDGYVYMLGRADDIINVGGEKVSPIEVENIACEYEDLKECACIGVTDPKNILGQVPVLFVVSKGGSFSEKDMQTYLSSRMERYKLPQYYVLLDEIPRNYMKKIDRKELKSLWETQKDNSLVNPVIQAILTRRSVRRFTNIPIPKETLNMILKAGYYAPTGHNLQTWRFTVIQNADKIAKLKNIVQQVSKDKKVNFYGFENPPCIILISNDKRNINGGQDASCAAENIFLAAHSYGIGSVWLNPLLTICDEPLIRELLDSFGIPKTHIVWCMAALGYPETEGVLLAKKKDVVCYVD